MDSKAKFGDRIRRNQRVRVRRSAETGVLLLALGINVLELDSVGESLWHQFDGARSLSSVITAVAREYAVASELVFDDAEPFIAMLIEERFLELVVE